MEGEDTLCDESPRRMSNGRPPLLAQRTMRSQRSASSTDGVPENFYCGEGGERCTLPIDWDNDTRERLLAVKMYLVVMFPIKEMKLDRIKRVTRSTRHGSIKKIRINDSVVFKQLRDERIDDVKHIKNRLDKRGLVCTIHEPPGGKVINLHVGISPFLAEVLAESNEVELQLKPEMGDWVVCRYDKFTRENRDAFMRRDPQDPDSLFLQTDIHALLHRIVFRELELGKFSLSTYNIGKIYSMHDHDTLDKLIRKWTHVCNFFTHPLEEAYAYFGARVTLYFSFLSFYLKWLTISSIFGTFVGVVYIGLLASSEKRWLDFVVIFYCVLLVLWSTLFIRYWERESFTHVFLWNSTTLDNVTEARHGFVGKMERNEITGEVELHYPMWKRLLMRYPASLLVTALCLVSVVSIITGILLLKASKIVGIWTSPLAGVANGVAIFVMNTVYKRIALAMNNVENHKTQASWENAFILKTFAFQFVNSYASLYYVAFAKGRLTFLPEWMDNHCLFDSCFFELSVQLTTLFGTQLIIGQCLEVSKPLMTFAYQSMYRVWARSLERVNMKKDAAVESGNDEEEIDPETGKSETSRKTRRGTVFSPGTFARKTAADFNGLMKFDETDVELQGSMAEYEVFDDYSELVMQYGYVTLFASALPIAPLLAALNNWVEIRTDFSKTKFMQRPTPAKATNIGSWFIALRFLSFAALLTNCGMIVEYGQSEYVHDELRESWLGKLFYFFILEHALLLVTYISRVFVQPVPRNLRKQVERIAYERAMAVDQRRLHNFRIQLQDFEESEKLGVDHDIEATATAENDNSSDDEDAPLLKM